MLLNDQVRIATSTVVQHNEVLRGSPTLHGAVELM